MKSRCDGEIVSNGSVKDGDSELVRTLKETCIKYKPSWRITEEAYAMLDLIMVGLDIGIERQAKLAKYILKEIIPDYNIIISSNRVANSANTMEESIVNDSDFKKWLACIEKRKTKEEPFPEDAIFRG